MIKAERGSGYAFIHREAHPQPAQACGLTQEELAQRLYVTRQTVSLWELGKTRPDVETLQAIADCLGVDLLQVLYGPEQTAPQSTTRRLIVWAAVSGGVGALPRGVMTLVHSWMGRPGTHWLGLVCACGQRLSLDGIVWMLPSSTAVRDVAGKNFEPCAHSPPAAVDGDWTGGSGDMDHLLCEPAYTAALGQFGCLADAASPVAVSAAGAALPPELAVVAAHVGPETRKRALRGISERVLIAYRHRR